MLKINEISEICFGNSSDYLEPYYKRIIEEQDIDEVAFEKILIKHDLEKYYDLLLKEIARRIYLSQYDDISLQPTVTREIELIDSLIFLLRENKICLSFTSPSNKINIRDEYNIQMIKRSIVHIIKNGLELAYVDVNKELTPKYLEGLKEEILEHSEKSLGAKPQKPIIFEITVRFSLFFKAIELQSNPQKVNFEKLPTNDIFRLIYDILEVFQLNDNRNISGISIIKSRYVNHIKEEHHFQILNQLKELQNKILQNY